MTNHVDKIIFAAIVGVFGVAVYAIYLVLAAQLAVVNEVQVGEAIHVTSDCCNSNINSSVTVETTEGMFFVEGPFHLIKGNDLTIQTLGSGSRHLCDPVQDYCARLK